MEDAIIMVTFFSLIGWLWMILDCIAYETEDKAIWMSILLVANIAGAFAYLALRYRTNRKGFLVQEAAEPSMQS